MYDTRYKDLLDGNDPIHVSTNIGQNVRIGYGTIIEEQCIIKRNTLIGHHCVLRPNTVIGMDCKIGHLTVFEGNCRVGDRVLIHAQCHITKDVIIEDDVFIAPFFCGANTMKIVHGRNYPLKIEGYRIKRAARIGIGVLVLPGVTIGEDALIGAGSLVIRDVPDRECWIGRPARRVRNVPDEELLWTGQ